MRIKAFLLFAGFVNTVESTALPWPLQASPAQPPPQIFNVLMYGAKGDNATDNTDAFLAAFKAARKNGGGTVYFPTPGTYLTLPLEVPAVPITIRVDAGVHIKGNCARKDRWPVVPCLPSYCGNASTSTHPMALLYGDGVFDFTLEGGGSLDGSGDECWWHQGGDRGHIVELRKSARISVRNITLTQSPFWTFHIWDSVDVHVKGIRVMNPSGYPYGPNTDGIDVDSSRRVLIEESFFQAGDDCIVIKSGKDSYGRAYAQPSKDIAAVRNTFSSCSCFKEGSGGAFPGKQHWYDGCAAMKVGTEMSGGVENVIFEDATVLYAGQAIKMQAPATRGGYVRNVTWRRLKIHEVATPILWQVGNQTDMSEVAKISNLQVQDVVVDKVGCHWREATGKLETECGSLGIVEFNSRVASTSYIRMSNITIRHTSKESDWFCGGVGGWINSATNIAPPLPLRCTQQPVGRTGHTGQAIWL